MTSLLDMKCQHGEGNPKALRGDDLNTAMEQLSGWQLSDDKSTLKREFKFKNFYHTMAFVNAVAWIANKEAHHPDMEVGYGRALVQFTTHDIDGLSWFDAICAAKVGRLLDDGDYGPKVVD